MFDFTGQTVFVTCAAGIFGAAIAQALGSICANLALADVRTKDGATRIVQERRARFGNVDGLTSSVGTCKTPMACVSSSAAI